MKHVKMQIRNRRLRFTITITKNLLLILTAGFLSAQQTPQELVAKMGRGINLGNVLSAPIEGNWSGAATEQYFQEVADAGFTNVRIPIDFFGERTINSAGDVTYSTDEDTTFEGSRSDFVVRASYLDRLETVIGWGLANNLVVVLDFHGATLKSEFIYTFDSDESAYYTHPTSAKRAADLAKFYSIWEQIAERFKTYSDDLVFEVINEPYFHISEADMNAINTEVISIVRNSGSNNEKRKIIITGGTETSADAVTTISPQILNSDNYLIATFHYYRPFNFTKSSSDGKDQNNWGTATDLNAVASDFDGVAQWAAGFNPVVAVYLGEFGADNYYGYDYSEGDLKVISTNPTGFSDGGPDPKSRVAFHGYVANAAIDRGFAFSAWDDGGKGSKTIHLRKDSGLTVYDMDFFSIDSFLPKSTSSSTVLESSAWVDEVKDALLNPYTQPACNDNDVLKNMDFECGFSTDWSFLAKKPEAAGSVAADKATYEDASFTSRSGSHGAKINVFQSGILNTALLSNTTYNASGNLDNKRLTFSVYGKGNVVGLPFKLRSKYNQSGTDFISVSDEYILGTSYPETPYSFSFDVPTGTSSIQLQLMCGADAGTYYFDDFSVSEQTLGLKEVAQQIHVYPNPTHNSFSVSANTPMRAMTIYDINGKLQKRWYTPNEHYELSFLKKGLYFIEYQGENNLNCVTKIIKK